jgi:hypothetical protein
MGFADRKNKLISELMETMSAREMDLWQAWSAREPSSSERIELAVAKLCYIMAKANSSKGADVRLEHFVYRADWRDEITAESEDFVKEFIKGFT